MDAPPLKERKSPGKVELILPLPITSKPAHVRAVVVIVICIFIGQVLATIFAGLTPIVPAVWFIVFASSIVADIIGRLVITITPEHITTHRAITARIQHDRQVIAITTELIAVVARHRGTIGGEAILPKDDPSVLAVVLPNDEGQEVVCDVLEGYNLHITGPLAGQIAQAVEAMIDYERDISAYVVDNTALHPDELFEPSEDSRFSITEEDDALTLHLATEPIMKTHGGPIILAVALILFGLGMVVVGFFLRHNPSIDLVGIPIIAAVIVASGAAIWIAALLVPRQSAAIHATSEVVTITHGKRQSREEIFNFVPASLVAIQAATPHTGRGLELRFIFNDGAFLNALEWASDEDVVLMAIALRSAYSLPSIPSLSPPRPARAPEPALN